MLNNLSKILAQKSVSITELSKITGLGRTTLSTLNNSVEIPEKTKIGTLTAICTALNISINELIASKEQDFTLNWYPLIGESEHDTGIIAINVKNEFGMYCSLFFIITNRILLSEVDAAMGREEDKLYTEYAERLKKIGESLENLNSERFFSDFNKALEKHPEEEQQFMLKEEEIKNSFFSNNTTHIDKIELNLISSEDLKKFSNVKPDLYNSILNENSEISFDRIAKELTESELSKLSKSINTEIIQKRLDSTEAHTFSWSLGIGVYGEYRNVSIFNRKGNYGSLRSSFTQTAALGTSMFNRLMNYL